MQLKQYTLMVRLGAGCPENIWEGGTGLRPGPEGSGSSLPATSAAPTSQDVRWTSALESTSV